MALKSEAYYSLDGVGAFVWDLLQEPSRVSDLREAIYEEYEVGRAQCEGDLLALLEKLALNQLIDIKNEPAP